MGALLGEVMAIGLIMAVAPTRIITTILLLTSVQPLRNALAYLAGLAGVYLLVGLMSIVFYGRVLDTGVAGLPIIDAILAALGVLLLGVGAGTFFFAGESDAGLPPWLGRVSTFSARQSFLLGSILACSLRYLLIFLSGVSLIYESEISPGRTFTALLMLIAIALLGQIAPVALYAADSSRARVQLSTLTVWLGRHHRSIVTVSSLILGTIFVIVGLNGLIPALGR